MKSSFEQIFDNVGSQIDQLFNQQEAAQDIKKSTKAIIQSAFERLDLVSREEFDAQAAVLAKTREKLDALEEKLK